MLRSIVKIAVDICFAVAEMQRDQYKQYCYCYSGEIHEERIRAVIMLKKN